jgi:hypothetical protein
MKKIIHSVWLTLTLILVALPAQALEPFALLDDFSGDRIDENLWNESRRPDADILDFAREVTGGELRLMGRSYADAPAPGGTNFTAVRLSLNNSDVINQALVRLRVNAVELSGCTDSAIASQIRARLSGYFFTTDGPPAPADATRNIFVNVQIRRFSNSIGPPGVMRIVPVVQRCGDANCSVAEVLFFDPDTLGTISPGQSALLALVWDQNNDRFLFARDSVAQLTVYNYNGVLTDVDPPSTDLSFVSKRLEIRANIENCVTGPRASGFMDLSVDKLWVNQSAVSP